MIDYKLHIPGPVNDPETYCDVYARNGTPKQGLR